MKSLLTAILVCLALFSCKEEQKETISSEEPAQTAMEKNLSKYVNVTLTADLNGLTDNERKMLPLLIQAADEINDVFWHEAYGDKNASLESIKDENVKKYALINYGPWDRLDGNKHFVDGVGEKPKGANFYPKDMTKEEFEAADSVDKSSIYNFVRRDAEGKLYS